MCKYVTFGPIGHLFFSKPFMWILEDCSTREDLFGLE